METYQPESYDQRISYQDDRISFHKYSPPRQTSQDSLIKPPKVSRDVDVLLRANEVLQRSLKFSNTPANDVDVNRKSSTFTTGGPGNNEANILNSKTYDVLNRANEILKKSSNYSKDFGRPIDKGATLKYYSAADYNGFMTTKDKIGYHEKGKSYQDSYSTQTYKASFASAEKDNNPRDILSKVEMALQTSSQIPSDYAHYSKEARANSLILGNIIRSEVRNSQIMRETQNNYRSSDIDKNRNNQYETPQRSHSKGLYETNKNQPKNYLIPPSFNNLETQIPSDINCAYTEALRRSQEVILRNEGELNRIEFRASAADGRKDYNNLRSSYVMERQTASSQYENDGYSQGVGREELPPPGIHIETQGNIKPKFVEEYLDDGTVYKGEKIRTAKHGRGEFLSANGSKYEGEWENDKRNGFGVYQSPSGRVVYDGEWKDDLYNGNGILVNEQATPEGNFDYRDFDSLENHWVKYEGEFLNGKMHGLGTLTLFNNERYVGKFKYDKVHGAGTFHRGNGETISAEWENNKLSRVI